MTGYIITEYFYTYTYTPPVQLAISCLFTPVSAINNHREKKNFIFSDQSAY